MNAPKLPWSADAAMREMWAALWAALDLNQQTGKLQKFFRDHLQAAYDAGVREAHDARADRL